MKPISFTKVAIKKFAELADSKRGVQFFIGETTQIKNNLLVARSGDAEVMLMVDDDNLRLFAYEILTKVGNANN